MSLKSWFRINFGRPKSTLDLNPSRPLEPGVPLKSTSDKKKKSVYAECVGQNDEFLVDYVLCSDSKCPCDQTKLYRNTGYIYVNTEFVEFRRDCLSWNEMNDKLERIRLERDVEMFFVDTGIGVPIMMCEQGAKLRGLNLDVAASDARHWWETGKVPLRVTPQKNKPKRKPYPY